VRVTAAADMKTFHTAREKIAAKICTDRWKRVAEMVHGIRRAQMTVALRLTH